MHFHHAVVYVADSLESSSVPEIYKTQSSDISHIVVDRFSIDDARQLSKDALQKPVDSDTRVFTIVTKKLPEESQNALLKLFEEPPEQTQFHLVIPQEGMLIATLRSRVYLSQVTQGVDVEKNETFGLFFSASYAQRLATIVDITKKKDLQAIENVIKGTEEYVAKNTQKYPELLDTVLFVREYSKTPGASAKMLLEELALALPKA